MHYETKNRKIIATRDYICCTLPYNIFSSDINNIINELNQSECSGNFIQYNSVKHINKVPFHFHD